MVQHRKEPGGVDPHQPVRFGPAERRFIQSVVVRTGAEVCKTLPDSRILHTGDPQPLHGLLAARQLVDAAEDQLALAPGVAGVDHFIHIRGVQQPFQHIELPLFVFSHRHLPVFRQDGQIVIAPLGVLRVIAVRVRQPGQMAHAPADPPAVSLKISIFAGGSPDHGRQAGRDRRLLSNHQFHIPHPPILPASPYAVFFPGCFHRSAAGRSRSGSHSGTAPPAGR